MINKKLLELLDSWYPKANDLFEQKVKHENSWKLTPIPNAKENSIIKMWKGMPNNAVEYLKSLPEFNAKIFEKITGIKSN